VMFDKHGNVNLQRQNIDYAPTPAATVSYDDSILKHLDIDDLRIVESSQLKQVNTVSGKLELGHRRRNR